jgi:fibronectin-binding autotransporter adhesin
MVCGGLTEISKNQNAQQPARRRGHFKVIALAIAAAVPMLGFVASEPVFAGTYAYVFPGPAGSTVDWMTPSAWTLSSGTADAANYPGGDPTEVDDASFSFVATTAAGTNNITLSSPLANSLGNLTMTLQDTTSTDQLNLVLNANLSILGNATLTGGSTGSSNRGLVTMTSAVGTTLNIAGTLTLASANGNGSLNTLGYSQVTINGNASIGGVNFKNDADDMIVSATAGTVNLGNVNLGRTLNNATASSHGGLHLLGGSVTATSLLIGSADSSADVEVNGANLTVTGSFIVGDNSSASPRTSSLFQTLGNVSAANSTLFIGSSTVGTVGAYVLGNTTATSSNNSLTVAGIQMTSVGGATANKASFTMANGTLLNVGAAGIGTGTGTYTFTNNGGTIAATANFTSTANTVINNAVTFQSADGLGNPFNMTFSGAISGNAALTKNGGGNLTLSGANSYTGGTTVNAGKLFVNNSTSNATVSGTGTGAVIVNNATLGGSGTILGAVTIGSGSHLAPGNNNVGTLVIAGGLTLSSGSILDFDFNASANSLLNLSGGTFTVASAGINVFAEGTTNPFETNGTYNLIQVTGTPSTAGLSILNGVAGVGYALGTSGHDVTLTITGGTGALGWAHDISGSWGVAANWNGGIPSGSLAILGNVLSAPRTVTLDGSRSITGLNLNSPFGYTISQGSGGSLILDNGTSTAAVNDFAGPHVISAPVTLNSATTINTTNTTDTLTVSGAISGAGGLTVAGPGTVILTNNANSYAGTTVNTGNIQVGSGSASGSFGVGTVTNTGSISFNSSSNTTISTILTGSGSINQNGTGVLTLSGVNTFTGTLNINSGIVQYGTTTGLSTGNINIVSPGILNLNGLSVSVSNPSGNGTIDNLATGVSTILTFNGAGSTFNGVIQNTAGNLTVNVATSGKFALGGNSTYTGGTNVTAGQLVANSNNALGTGTVTLTSTTANTLLLGSNVVVPNNIVLNDGSIEFTDLNTGGTTATFAGNISVTGSTQYRLGNSNTTSTIDMTGASTTGASAITILTRGNLVFEGNGSLVSTGQAIVVGRSSGTAILNLTIMNNAVVAGVGVDLGGLNSTSDDLTANITLSNNGTLDAGTGAFLLNNNDVGNSSTPSAITLTTNDNSTVRGSAFTMVGSSTHTSTFWLATGGNIVATANNVNFMPANSNLTFDLAGTININDGGFHIGIAEPIGDFGGGAINKVGNGSLSLSGANAYGSGTTVSAGTLYADGSISPLGSGSVIVNSGATLGGSGVISQVITLNNGSHLAPGDGATTGKLTLNNGVTLPSGSTLDFNFKADGTANSLLELTSGVITNSGAGINLYDAGTTTPFDLNGTYTLVTFDGGFVDPALSVLDQVAGVSYGFSSSGNSLVLTITGGPSSSVWNLDGNGSWANAANWIGGVPNAASSVATFGSVITAARTVTLDGNETVGFVTFNNANSYTINGGTGGTLILDNGVNPAQITDSAGTHFINVPMTLNSNTGIAVTNAADTLNISGNIGGAGTLTVSGAGSVVLGGTNSFAGAFTSTSTGTVSLTGVNSFASLTNSGTGTIILSGANTYSGPTTISAGKIQLASGGTLGNGLSSLSIASGATLDLNGQNATVGSLSGAGTIDDVAGGGTSSLTTGGLNANVTFSGVIKNTTGAISLTKVGTGNLILSGNSTYTGGTVLTSGGLYATNTAGSATGTGSVTLNGGTLGGTGTISGSVIAGSGAHTINPGSSTANSIGKLTLGALSTNGNTTLAFDLATPTGTSDVLAVTGALNLAGGKLTVNSQTTTGAASLGYYKVLSYGTLTGSTSGIVLPAVANNVAYTLDTTHDAGFVDIHRGFIGDANDSGTVDSADLTLVLNNLGTTTSLWSSGNFDGAPTIDLTDLNDVLNHLGTSIASTSTVIAVTNTPEPASLSLLALGAAALIARRRKA